MPLLSLFYPPFFQSRLLLFDTWLSFIIQGVKCFLPSASRFHPRIISFSCLFPVLTAFGFQYPHRKCHTSSQVLCSSAPQPPTSLLPFLSFSFLSRSSVFIQTFQKGHPLTKTFLNSPHQNAFSLPSELSRTLKHLSYAAIILGYMSSCLVICKLFEARGRPPCFSFLGALPCVMLHIIGPQYIFIDQKWICFQWRTFPFSFRDWRAFLEYSR